MTQSNSIQKDNLTDLVHPPKPAEAPKPQPAPESAKPGQVMGSNGNPITLGYAGQYQNSIRK